MKTINILKEYAVNETNEAGVKGLVIWEEDFQEITDRIEGLGGSYTKKDIVRLLKEQREICYQSAKIVEHKYDNPYSDSDGQTTITIDKKSIINAKIPKL